MVAIAVFTHSRFLNSLYHSQLSPLKGNDKDDEEVIDVDELDDEAKGMRRSGRQKDERAAVESAASKRATRQVGNRAHSSLHWVSPQRNFNILHIVAQYEFTAAR